MDAGTAAYWLAVAAFALGTVIAVALYRSLPPGRDRRVLAFMAVIPGFAGVSYVAMALGIGTITVGGRPVVLARYVDWLVTTPLLVGFVGWIAGASRRAVGGVMIADALMIVVGVAANLSTGTTKWALFGLSVLFHVSLFAYLYGVFPRTLSDDPRRIGLFALLKNHIGLLWVAYPVVWLAGPTGLGYSSVLGTTLVYAFLDVAAKVPYVYFFYSRRGMFGGDDPTAGAAGAAADPGAGTAD